MSAIAISGNACFISRTACLISRIACFISRIVCFISGNVFLYQELRVLDKNSLFYIRNCVF